MTRLAPVPRSTREIERRAALDPVALAVGMATAYLEVRSGRRPPDQLHPYLGASARRRLRLVVVRNRRGWQRPCGGASVTRVVQCRPAEGILEAAVVVREDDAVRVVAMRVERRRGRWVVTDLGLPEDRRRLDASGPGVAMAR